MGRAISYVITDTPPDTVRAYLSSTQIAGKPLGKVPSSVVRNSSISSRSWRTFWY